MPENLILEETEDTPAIKFNREAGVFKISGRSYPENAAQFFKPIISWLEIYSANPNPATVFEVDLEYVNSGSVKQVFNMLFIIEDIMETGNEAKIIWCYRKGDELMQQKGEEFQKFLQVEVELQAR